MKDATLILLITGWISSVIYSKYIIRTYINPALIFTSMWLLVFVLFQAHFLNYYPLEERTYWVISIGYVAFSTGLMYPFLFFTPLRRREANYHRGFPHRRFNWSLNSAYLLGVLGFYLFYREVTAHFTISQLLDPFAYQELREMLLEEKIGGRLILYLSKWSEIALVFSVFYAVYFKKKYLRILLYFIPILAYTFLSTGRSLLFSYLFGLFGSYVLIKQLIKNEPIRKRMFVLFPLLLVLSFGGIGILLLKVVRFTRHVDTQNIIESQLYMFYFYISSPIGALNRLLMEEQRFLELGRNTLAPVLRLVKYFFADINPPHIHQAFTNTPYRTNVYTYIRVIYRDFGVAGVATIPFLMGLIVSSAWGRLSHMKNIIFLPVICHLMFVVFMTTFEDLFFRTTPLILYFYALIFLKMAGVKKLIRPVVRSAIR